MNRSGVRLVFAVILALAGAGTGGAQQVTKDTGQVRVPGGAPGLLIHRQPPPDFRASAVYQWVDCLLDVSGRDSDRNQPRPPILSRTMAIVLTAMYDAWAAYDDKAVGTRLHDTLRRPRGERTAENKEKAIAYAAYRSLLFVYPDERVLSYWMKNTLIPLSIAYIDSEGRIVDIQDMKPLDDKPPHYESSEPVQYALEVNQGFFEENGVKEGDHAELPG